MNLPNEPAGADGTAEARETPPSPEDWHKPDCKFRKYHAVIITINTPFICPLCGGRLREINTEGK